jgi:hypothetical protein
LRSESNVDNDMKYRAIGLAITIATAKAWPHMPHDSRRILRSGTAMTS